MHDVRTALFSKEHKLEFPQGVTKVSLTHGGCTAGAAGSSGRGVYVLPTGHVSHFVPFTQFLGAVKGSTCHRAAANMQAARSLVQDRTHLNLLIATQTSNKTE